MSHIPRPVAAIDARAPLPEPLADDALITQPQLKRLAGDVSDMTIWRWRKAGILPHPVNIRGRNYWRTGVARNALASLMDGGAAPTEEARSPASAPAAPPRPPEAVYNRPRIKNPERL